MCIVLAGCTVQIGLQTRVSVWKLSSSSYTSFPPLFFPAGVEKEVVVTGGLYTLNAPLSLTAADSGLVLRAAAGDRVVVSGAVASPPF